MPKTARILSESKMYHVVTKGAGGQVTFEDDDDRMRFLKSMERYSAEDAVVLYAWCLMGNHVHMVLESEVCDLSRFMLRLETGYVNVFNKKYDRVGALFQHGFWSDPIESDERLLATIRYVHQNPLKPKLAATCGGYRWSSYNEYVVEPFITCTEPALNLLGSLDEFKRFHLDFDDRNDFIDIDTKRVRRTNSEALAIAHDLLGEGSVSKIMGMPKQQRDECIRLLKSRGLTHRQISWMTGAGANIIARA